MPWSNAILGIVVWRHVLRMRMRAGVSGTACFVFEHHLTLMLCHCKGEGCRPISYPRGHVVVHPLQAAAVESRKARLIASEATLQPRRGPHLRGLLHKLLLRLLRLLLLLLLQVQMQDWYLRTSTVEPFEYMISTGNRYRYHHRPVLVRYQSRYWHQDRDRFRTGLVTTVTYRTVTGTERLLYPQSGQRTYRTSK